MRGCPSLYRRPSGIYAVRIVVPRRLRGLVGRGEIHASTGIKDWGAAKVVALRIQLYWRDHFVTLDIERLTTASPLLQGDGTIGIQDAARIIGMPDADLMREMMNGNTPVLTYVQNLSGWQVSDINDIDREDGHYVLNDVEAKGYDIAHTGYLRFHDNIQTLSGLIVDGSYKESVFRSSGASAIFLSIEIEIHYLRCVVLKSDIEKIRVRLAGYVPAQPMKSLAPAVATAPEVQGGVIVYDRITAKHGKTRFSALYKAYSDDRITSDSHAKRMETEAGLFRELMGDPELGTIDKQMIQMYGVELEKLPTDTYQAKRKFKTDSLLDLIPITEQYGLKRKTVKTIKGHIGRLSEILKYGQKNEMLHTNPAADYKRGHGKFEKKRAQDERYVFDDSELALIFSQDWYSSGSGEFTEKGSTNWRPHHYWLPLLGLLTGARLNELSQLYLNDIRQTESDSLVWYIDLNLDKIDKAAMDFTEGKSDKSLKTVNSIRVVPLHDVFVRLGLLKYVTALRKAGHARLFPELKHDENKGYGKPAGKWFNEYFLGKQLGMERNGMKTFHSFRHCFLTAIERTGATERIMAELAGHQRGETLSMTRYTKDHSASEMKLVIDHLSYPFLDAMHPFDINAGLRALNIANRLKLSMARAKRTK